MSILKIITIIIFFATVVLSKQLTFHDHKVFSVKVQTEEQYEVLSKLEDIGSDGYSYWKEPILGRDADIVVPPHKLNDFNTLVETLNLNSTLKIKNIQQ